MAGGTKKPVLVHQTIGSLAGVAGSNVRLGVGTLTRGGNNNPTAFAGVISGTGGLVKQRSGAFTLSSDNMAPGSKTRQFEIVDHLGVEVQPLRIAAGDGVPEIHESHQFAVLVGTGQIGRGRSPARPHPVPGRRSTAPALEPSPGATLLGLSLGAVRLVGP